MLELGPRDLASGNIVIKRRDTGAKEISRSPRSRRALRQCSKPCRRISGGGEGAVESEYVIANSIGEVEDILRDVTAEKGGGKFVMAHVKDDAACDARLKEFKATVRNIPLVDEYDGGGKCIITGEPVDRRVVIAKSY